jgi:hypothetical protein
MREETAEEYVQAMKTMVDGLKATIPLLIAAVCPINDEQREAIKAGMSVIPGLTVRSEDQERVPLILEAGEPDWQKLKEIFLKYPEPSPEHRVRSIELLTSMNHLLRRAFSRASKMLPHAPGGHPFALMNGERIDACKRIEAYRIKSHMDTPQAIATVASELSGRVSQKTLRRYYVKYLEERGERQKRPRARKQS